MCKPVWFPGLITTSFAEIYILKTKGLSYLQGPQLDLLLIGKVGYLSAFVRNIWNATSSLVIDLTHSHQLFGFSF